MDDERPKLPSSQPEIAPVPSDASEMLVIRTAFEIERERLAQKRSSPRTATE